MRNLVPLSGCGLASAELATDSDTTSSASLRTLDAAIVSAQLPATLECGETARASVTG